MGVDFKLRTIEANGRRTKLQIWDTAGQERFRTVSSTYYRGAHGVAIVYDVASAASFANVTRWIGEIDRYGRPGVPKILLGNKADLPADARETTAGVARKFAEEHHLAFAEVSAKTGDGVDDAFATLAQLAATKVAALPQQVARDEHRRGDAGERLRMPNTVYALRSHAQHGTAADCTHTKPSPAAYFFFFRVVPPPFRNLAQPHEAERIARRQEDDEHEGEGADGTTPSRTERGAVHREVRHPGGAERDAEGDEGEREADVDALQQRRCAAADWSAATAR